MKFKSIREDCATANRELAAQGLVDLTFGNVSVYDPAEKVLAIKPSGVPYDQLTSEKIVVVDLDGEIIAGELRPSSDTPTHRCLYLAFSHAGVRAIAHTHSRAAVAFAQAACPIPCLGTTHADFFHGSIPVTREMTESEVKGDYEWETGRVIIETFESIGADEMPGVIVRNHGPFAWGNSGGQAVEHASAMEIVADMALKTLTINRSAAEVSQYLLDRHFSRKHGPSAYYGQNYE